MKYLYRAIIYNLLCLIQLAMFIVGWYFVIIISIDIGAKVMWIVFSTYFSYIAEHPFFMPFKEPAELLSIEVSVGKEPLE